MHPLFCRTLVLCVLITASCSGPKETRHAAITHGPFVGHVDTASARIWARASAEGEIVAHIRPADDLSSIEFTGTALAKAEHDRCVTIHVTGLAPDTSYRYQLEIRGEKVANGEELRFRTPPSPEVKAIVSLAFGSCASHEKFKNQPVWTAIGNSGALGMVLLGDTPYINSTKLEIQRKCRQEFFSVPELSGCLSHLPFWGTWDDHDLGANDTDGVIEGKEFSRKAFLEYHPNPSFGAAAAGVYTSFRTGPMEVFLLDTRWFANTEPSLFDSEEKTLLGKAQWAWLTDGLRKSTATFKILACGMVWNGSVRPFKKDHWMNWPIERHRLFRFLGDERITGVCLVSGDIHVSRAFRFPVKDIVGYDLTELITSPLANTNMAISRVESPECIAHGEDQHSFLLLTADTTKTPATLTGRMQSAGGRELFTIRLTDDELRPQPR